MEKERIKMEKAGLSQEEIEILQQSLAAVRAAGIEMGVEDLIRAAKVLGQSGWSMEELEKIRPPSLGLEIQAAAADLPVMTIDEIREVMEKMKKKAPRPEPIMRDISIPMAIPVLRDPAAAFEEHMRKDLMQNMGIGIDFLKGGRRP